MLYTHTIFYQIVSLMIQFCTENKLFSILKSCDTACFLGNSFFDIVFVFSEFLVTSILLYHICKAGFSLHLLFWYSIFVFHDFLGTLLFDISFYFQDFLGICTFHKTVAIQNFPDNLHFLYAIFDVQFSTSSFYTVLQIVFYHHISFSLTVFSFLNFHDILFFENSNLSATLQPVAPLFNESFMAFLLLTVQWTFINCNRKYGVSRHRVSIAINQ